LPLFQRDLISKKAAAPFGKGSKKSGPPFRKANFKKAAGVGFYTPKGVNAKRFCLNIGVLDYMG
jgi:hypothetical protein